MTQDRRAAPTTPSSTLAGLPPERPRRTGRGRQPGDRARGCHQPAGRPRRDRRGRQPARRPSPRGRGPLGEHRRRSAEPLAALTGARAAAHPLAAALGGAGKPGRAGRGGAIRSPRSAVRPARSAGSVSWPEASDTRRAGRAT
ncbi:hypothetical protein LV779_24500 [Streptomyces thinghirensis]|nr:hypothetical protein [Streptomyces thinghirensis]